MAPGHIILIPIHSPKMPPLGWTPRPHFHLLWIWWRLAHLEQILTQFTGTLSNKALAKKQPNPRPVGQSGRPGGGAWNKPALFQKHPGLRRLQPGNGRWPLGKWRKMLDQPKLAEIPILWMLQEWRHPVWNRQSKIGFRVVWTGNFPEYPTEEVFQKCFHFCFKVQRKNRREQESWVSEAKITLLTGLFCL